MTPHAPDAPREHRAAAPAALRVAVLTVSDSRKPSNDASGDLAAGALEAAGHTVAWRRLVRDEAADIAAAVRDALEDAAVDALVATGGTGVAPRDVTIETARPFFDKELPGFGELYRMLSWQEIGSAALASRATAGIAAGKPAFFLPGSPAAVDLAVSKLVAPELAHLVSLARAT